MNVLGCLVFLNSSRNQHIQDLKKLGFSLSIHLAQDSEVIHAINCNQPAFLDASIKKIKQLDTEGEIGYWRISGNKKTLREDIALTADLKFEEIPVYAGLQEMSEPMVASVRSSAGERFFNFIVPVLGKKLFSEEVFASQMFDNEDVPCVLGYVQIGLSTYVMNKKIYHVIIYNIIPMGLGFIFGGICLALSLSKYLVSPLQHLTNMTREVAKGNLALRAKVGSNDEIGMLSGNFNKMTTYLEESYRDLKREIGEKNRAMDELRKLSMAVEQSPCIVMITDIRGNIEYVNKKFEQITGYTFEDAVGKNPRFLKSGDLPEKEYKYMWKTIMSGREWRGEFINKKKDGELYYEHAYITPIRDSHDTITHFLGVKEDITERKNYEKQLLYLADHDPLTSLYNRRRFQKDLEFIILQSKRYNIIGALLFIDLDNFKYINDSLGHQYGDELLISIAHSLRNNLRKADLISRLGGDEFAVILHNTSEQQAVAIANQILDHIKLHNSFREKGSATITASIGIALYPQHGNDAKELQKCADLAMYKAKEEGRNRSCVFSIDHKKQIEVWLEWEKQIRDALKNNMFVLYYQPIRNIKKRNLVGYEVLLRMIDKNNELILPSNFIKVAERIGLIHEIDRWVVRNTIRYASQYKRINETIRFEINLSGKALNDYELVSIVKQELEANNVDPKSIVFEITETSAVENMLEAERFISSLKEMGCCFALDDFGIGFSSFHYLKHLPIDYIKIDGSFVRNIAHNTSDQHLVRAMVEVARGLGKKTIAEFVESEEILQKLHEIGVDYAQGYFIGRPVSFSDILS